MSQTFLEFTTKTAIKAGKVLLKASKKELTVTEKSKNDFVTNADLASEAFIIKAIKKTYPDHAILAEESATTKIPNTEYLWIIDPLDGTTNFAHEIPQYCVSIGLLKISTEEKSKNFKYLTGEIICGAVYAPRLDELFYASKGTGAYLKSGSGRPKRLHVSNIRKLEKAMAVTGFQPVHPEDNLPFFNRMIKNSAVVRRLGSAAIDLCYCAAGRIDGFWEFDLNPWDIAAGSLILEEAGGNATDSHGEQLDLLGHDILATNGHIHQEMIETLSA